MPVHVQLDQMHMHYAQGQGSFTLAIHNAGTAVATAPSAEMLQVTEDCAAKTTLQGSEGSVGAYDKVPLASASCLFSMDTSTDIFIMHSFQVNPHRETFACSS